MYIRFYYAVVLQYLLQNLTYKNDIFDSLFLRTQKLMLIFMFLLMKLIYDYYEKKSYIFNKSCFYKYYILKLINIWKFAI